MGIFDAIFAIALALVLVSLLLPVAERLRAPHTVLLAILGVALGAAATWTDPQNLGMVGKALKGLTTTGISPEALLSIFLPPLLFTAGLTIDVRRLFDEMAAVLLLAIVAVFVCIFVV